MKETKARLRVEGMTCEHCAVTVRKSLLDAGAKAAHVSFPQGVAEVVFDPETVSREKLAEAVSKAGYYATEIKDMEGEGEGAGEASSSAPSFILQQKGKGAQGAARLVVIGGGSAAFAAAIRAADLGAEVIIANEGLPMGGACVNVGCVPSKALIRAAQAHYRAGHPRFAGIKSESRIDDFNALMDEKRGLVRELRQKKYQDIIAALPSVSFRREKARLEGQGKVRIGEELLEADRIIIATGARPAALPIPGIQETGFLTNETALDLDELPRSLIVLGGNYMGLEMAQMFARFGTKVTVVEIMPRILPSETPDISEALLESLQEEGIEFLPGHRAVKVEKGGSGVKVTASGEEGETLLSASHLLVTAGRKANTEELNLSPAGVETDERGFIKVSDTLETTAEGIFAAGDVIGPPMFVYTAAYEGALAAENALSGSQKPADYTALPWVVFTEPQVAGVGMDEVEAEKAGLKPEVARLPLEHVPAALVAKELRGIVKLIRDRETDRLLGARIVAPHAGEMVMEIALAIKTGMKAGDLASLLHPYLTWSEAVKLAAITFTREVNKLSCCAT